VAGVIEAGTAVIIKRANKHKLKPGTIGVVTKVYLSTKLPHVVVAVDGRTYDMRADRVGRA
jgi:hypothetical protein